MSHLLWRLATSIAGYCLVYSSLMGAEPVADRVDYLREIKPLLKSRCYACHGALKQESGLRLDTGEFIRKGSQRGAIVVAGGLQSELLDRIRSSDLTQRMPPEGEPVTPDQIEKIARWIGQGAISPEEERPEVDPRSHWSFQSVVRPEVPQEPAAARVRNPIDAFIAVEHSKRRLTPAPPAAKHLLLRRVYLDLVGLPPSTEELREFLADDSPDAYLKVVDDLLNSPLYGERWGRHWMDVWRYSDWFGRRYVPDVWNSAPQIWRWRDWIVKSLNADKGYAQMVSEMLAADEVAPEDYEAGYATGYLIRNWYALNPNDWMRSNVEHVGKAFLGLTLNCAHCHDHKYDPISQDDYFRFRAFFEPISIRQDRVPGEADPGPFQEYQYSVLRKIIRLGGVRVYDKSPDATTWFYTGGDERNRVTERGSIPPGIPAFLDMDSFKIEPIRLPPRAWYPGLQPDIQQTILTEHQTAVTQAASQSTAIRALVEAAVPQLEAKLAKTESDLAVARQNSAQAGRSGALVGQQSLVLDATVGRRLVQHRLLHVTKLEPGSVLRFQMQLLSDAHVNFQLAKDVVKGLTAGVVIFEKGRILSYQPGSFSEFEVGRYDYAAGQNRFEVTFMFGSPDDHCQLTVRSMSDNAILVDHVVVARNGWNLVGDPAMGILFDARTGAVAAFDELTVAAANSTNSQGLAATLPVLAHFDFESPTYPDDHDMVDLDGWIGSSLSEAGASSRISSTFADPSLRPFSDEVRLARSAVDAERLKLASHQAKQVATVAELQAVKARIAADQATYDNTDPDATDQLSQLATQQRRDATLFTAQADLLSKEQILAAAEAKPLSDANRAKEILAASQQRSASHAVLELARQASKDSSQASARSPLSPTYPETSTGRRRALAAWIASRNNPLTARVAVNHIWLRHFHSPLVASVFDFGRSGTPPTHPLLLDWLAAELMEHDWSMKHLHRLIVTSNTYAMSSSSSANQAPSLVEKASDPTGQQVAHWEWVVNPSRDIDPENRFLWRMNVGRMEAEVVRDSLLRTAGQLNLQLGGQELENSLALTTYRKTLYYSCQPEIDGKSSFGALFDAPEPADCYRRTESIIPQQALALTNSDLIHQLSRNLTEALWQSLSPLEQSDPLAFVIAAHERILTRVPSDTERVACLEYLAAGADEGADLVRLREGLVRALLNHNDFVSIR